MMIERSGRFMYYLKLESLKLLERILHFREFEAPMIAIHVLMEAISS